MITPDEHDQRRRRVRARRPQAFKNAQGAVYGALAAARARSRSPRTSSSTGSARELNAQGPGAAGRGRAGSGSAAARASTSRASSAGLVPDAEWRNEGYDEYLKCAKKAKVDARTTAALFACGGIERRGPRATTSTSPSARATCRPRRCRWPIAYSAIANGGTRRHARTSGMEVEDGQGRAVEEIRTPVRRRVEHRRATARRSWTASGAATAAAAPRPTSSTASAHRDGVRQDRHRRARANPDQSWYAGYVDDPRSRSWSSSTIERGGFGAETAAPAARLILMMVRSQRRRVPSGAPTSR